MILDECFGDPFVWIEGPDHSEVLASNDWVLIKAPVLKKLLTRKAFQCWLCKKYFIDSDIKCLVGGHWTPHSSEDRPPSAWVHCCHQHQEEVR